MDNRSREISSHGFIYTSLKNTLCVIYNSKQEKLGISRLCTCLTGTPKTLRNIFVYHLTMCLLRERDADSELCIELH